jgi:hypothetical protein
VYEEPVYEEPVYEEPAVEEPAFEEPVYDVPAFEEPVYAQPVAEEPVYEEPAVEAIAFEAAFEAPSFDEPVPGEAPVAAGPPAETSSGRWALGGFAAQPGQHALGGVQFRQELPEAPAGWALAPALDAGPGTLVLVLDGAINCDGEDVAVVTDPGFAPTAQGFTVRVAAKASGPFAASGTFHVISG